MQCSYLVTVFVLDSSEVTVFVSDSNSWMQLQDGIVHHSGQDIDGPYGGSRPTPAYSDNIMALERLDRTLYVLWLQRELHCLCELVRFVLLSWAGTQIKISECM